MSQVADKPLRADARRNHEKVLAAARAVFAEQGRDAQIDDVARRAEVGVGTVYRHFPTKEALIEAIADDAFDRIAAETRGLLELDDAWEAFKRAVWLGAENLVGDRALAEVMAAQQLMPPRMCPGQLELQTIAATLMRRAQAAGQMRADAIIEDVPMLMCGIGSANTKGHPCADAWRRHVGIMLDGLQAAAASGPLPA